jgi:hypothetical protein
MIERITEIRRCYGIEKNVANSKVIKISWQPSPMQIMVDQNQPENMEYFSYCDSMIMNDARCACEIKSRIAVANAAFKGDEDSFLPVNWT